jgi:translocation and assembly module TamB
MPTDPPPDPTPAAPPAAGAPARARRRRFGWPRWLLGTLAVVLAPTLLLATLVWVLGTERGLGWALAQQDFVQAEQFSGSLLAGFSASRIVVRWGAAREHRVVIDGARASALHLAPGGTAAWLRLHAEQVSAQRVSVQLAPSDEPAQLPSDLRLPVEIEVDAARVGTLELPGLAAHPVRNASGQVHLGAQQGHMYRASGLRFAVGPLQWSGTAQIGTGTTEEGALPLRVELEAKQATDAQAPKPELPPWARALRQDWQARLHAQGPLARFAATLELRGQGQRLDARAVVTPIEAWPLPRLDLQTEQLDLSALIADAPRTALSGSIRIEPPVRQGALPSARVQMVNHRPGRWDQQGLPLRSAAFELRAPSGATGRLEFVNVQAALASDQRDAGTLQGGGQWSAGGFSLQARLAQVRPNWLDPRAPAMTLSGPISLSGQLAASGGRSASSIPAPAAEAAPGAPSNTVTPRFELSAELEGSLRNDAWSDAVGNNERSVTLKVSAAASPHSIEIRELQARAGSALLTLSGTAQRAAPAAPWQLDGKASVNDFDPLAWFPGAPESAWRRGPHRFNGDAAFSFALPSTLPSATGSGHEPQASPDWQDWLEWLPTVQGQAELNVRPSQLAGVALRGALSLHNSASAQSRFSAKLDAGGNSLNATGQWARGDTGRSDRWELEVQAAQLARLAAWRALSGVALEWPLPTGTLEAKVKLEGRWPTLRTQGQLSAQALRLAAFSVARGQARWNFDQAPNAPFDVQLDLSGARWEQQSAQSMKLNLQGTTEAHTLELRALLNVAAPAWTDFLLGQAPADDASRSTLVQLNAQGGLGSPAGATAAPRWQGTLQGLDLRSSAAGAAPLLRLSHVAIDLQSGAAAGAPRIALQAGAADLLGTRVHWEAASWQGAVGSSPAQIDLQARIDPIAIAPLLHRAQPHFGWRGDLLVGGHVNIRSSPSLQADMVFERLRGDLRVADELGTQDLQLTDLRFALAAQDGVWSFTQALAGKTLGEAAGAVTARLAPGMPWPGADTPIQGVLEARVANLGTWGAWVPPGWRLAGNLRTSATIGGVLGAPQVTGEIRGSGIGVRNIVQGVNIVDGEVDIRLQGASARIERFTAKAGNGSLRLDGDASLGEVPSAKVRLTADRFQLLGRVDRRIVASGNANLNLGTSSTTLDGRFTVDEGLIDFTRGDAPTLADDVRVAARPTLPGADAAPETPAEPARGTARPVAIDLQVGLGEQLRVRGRGLDTQLRGDLRLTTPGGKLAINGTVRAAAGTYAAYGQKLSIERGELVFTGVAENPRLDIIAVRPNLEQTVGVAVTGTALNPRVRLFSEPEMADIDKLSWLVLGRASDGLGRTDTALLQRAAIGLLAGEGTGPTDQLINAVGLDEVSFRQTEGEVRETVVSLGKQLSRRWYVGYERSLNATTGNWQLIYRIAQRLTLRAQSGLDNSLDAIWTWRWQ